MYLTPAHWPEVDCQDDGLTFLLILQDRTGVLNHNYHIHILQVAIHEVTRGLDFRPRVMTDNTEVRRDRSESAPAIARGLVNMMARSINIFLLIGVSIMVFLKVSIEIQSNEPEVLIFDLIGCD